MGEPRFRVLPDVLSGTLEVRFQACSYTALAHRKPVGIGITTGTGFTTPSF